MSMLILAPLSAPQTISLTMSSRCWSSAEATGGGWGDGEDEDGAERDLCCCRVVGAVSRVRI